MNFTISFTINSRFISSLTWLVIYIFVYQKSKTGLWVQNHLLNLCSCVVKVILCSKSWCEMFILKLLVLKIIVISIQLLMINLNEFQLCYVIAKYNYTTSMIKDIYPVLWISLMHFTGRQRKLVSTIHTRQHLLVPLGLIQRKSITLSELKIFNLSVC